MNKYNPKINNKIIFQKSLIIIMVLIWLSSLLGTWFFTKRYFNKSVNNYPLIDLSRNFIPQEHFLVNLQPLRNDLNQLVQKENPDSITIYLEFLNTGANISINQDLRIWPASLVKVPLAMGVMKKVESGDWSLSNELVLMKDDRDTTWGELYKETIGTPITIEKLLKELLINSDNTSFHILYRNLDSDELQDVIGELGLETLFSEEGKITAKEYSRLFRALYNSSYLKRENSEKILEWLSESPYDEYLGQGVPDETKFAHKIGENKDVNVLLDSGIVYISNRPYLITVMIDDQKIPGGRNNALKIMKEISEKSYEYIKNAKK